MLFAVLAAAGPGCAYMRDRGRDALDIVRVEVGYGLGASVDVRVTDLARVAVGAGYAKRAGLRHGALGNGEELVLGLPFAPFVHAAQKENGSTLLVPPGHMVVGLGLADWTEARPVGRSQAEGGLFSPLLLGASTPERPWTRALDLEVGVTAGVVSARVGFSPGELVDFVVGWFGFDPAGDDLGPRPRRSTGPAGAPSMEPGAPASSPEGGPHLASSPPATPSQPEPPAVGRRVRASAGAAKLTWISLDTHMHAQPADNPGHVHIDVFDSLDLAKARGVDAVVLTPHLWGTPSGRRGEPPPQAGEGTGTTARWRLGSWGGRRRGGEEASESNTAAVVEGWRAFVADARRHAAEHDGPIVVGGWEEGHGAYGHLAGFGVDLGEAIEAGGSPSEGVHARGVLAMTHPYMRRFHIPFAGSFGIPGYDPWREEEAAASAAGREPDGVHPLEDRYTAAEAFNVALDLAESANLVAREDRSVEKVLRRVERDILRLRRRITVVGGSDNHRDWAVPACWIGVRERTPEAVVDAVRAGRVVLGHAAARHLAIRSDREPGWQPIGASVKADREVELGWRGEAELWADGVLLGTFRDGHVVTIEPGSFHAYRIVQGESRSGWVFANLD